MTPQVEIYTREDAEARLREIDKEIKALKRQVDKIPFLDDFDLRYRRYEFVPIPITQAVMFCLMDTSGSMTKWHKEMGKRFFILLYRFLIRNYQRVEVVFIRHHHTAKEVGEEEFFYSRESGGTVMSTALVMMQDIIAERYPLSQWNIYGSHASDGDNHHEDSPMFYDLMKTSILPAVQYYAYVEITHAEREYRSDIWPWLIQLRKGQNGRNAFENLAMTRITRAEDIYPVFRDLFQKR